MAWNDDEYDLSEGLDPEGPSAEDLDRFGDEMTVCPSCGSDIYDQAEICHVCGHFIQREPGKLPTWVVVVAAVVLVGLLVLAL